MRKHKLADGMLCGLRLRSTAQNYAAMAGRIVARNVARNGECVVIVAHWGQGGDCMQQIWTDKTAQKQLHQQLHMATTCMNFFAQKCC
jgi:hypothetical protein